MTNTEYAPYRTITLAAAKRQGLKAVRMPVENLHKALPQDGSVTCIWEWFDDARYSITNLRATQQGVEIVCDPKEHKKAGGNGVVAIYPLGQGRTVRMLIDDKR